ncbi:MAG: hypothetical protein V1720_10390 [bacterium]
MKSIIFATAIRNRRSVRFVYSLREITLEPYYISINKTGRKVIFGRVDSTNEIKAFEYDKIFNIKVMSKIFSPIIPILPAV